MGYLYLIQFGNSVTTNEPNLYASSDWFSPALFPTWAHSSQLRELGATLGAHLSGSRLSLQTPNYLSPTETHNS